LRKEAPTTVDCLLPIGVIDEVRTASLQFPEATTETTYTTKVTLWVVNCAAITRNCMGLVVNVVFVVGPRLFDLPDDVEIFAHHHHPLANQISAGLPSFPVVLTIRARLFVLSRYSAAPIRSPDRFRPNRSRIAVRV